MKTILNWRGLAGTAFGALRNQPRNVAGFKSALQCCGVQIRNSQRGVALISVLAMLVLLSILIVGFLIRAGSENVASGNYRAVATTRILADTAVNLVQAEINEATTPAGGMAWASQPGAIRLFDEKGDLKKIYRLYSAASLVADTGNANVLASDIPVDGTWAASPSIWVDLNAPIKVSGTDTNLDGAVNASDAYLVYPVLDPRDPASPGTLEKPTVTTKMPGFSIAASAPVASDLQPAPMPVRWLYVLQDGKIVAPVLDSGGNGKIATVAGASASNPITGRIAFWADDESAKVNINTAGGSAAKWNGDVIPGTWDTPRYKVWLERMLFSENQPVKGEYQRYPAHPATTDLYGIVNALGTSLSGYPYEVSTYGSTPQPNPVATTSGLYSILARYSDDNSSRGGSRNTTKPPLTSAPVINGGYAKTQRLYTSVGELLYNPARNTGVFNRQQLESGKFFLTAQSRAPEVTLYGTPRIAMWPIHKDSGSTKRTAFDNLIAFCSTVGGKPYYVQRNDSRSATSDYDNIPRNKDLYSYLKGLTAKKVPGFGVDGSFFEKYNYSNSISNERDQILTEMLDYIRSTNLHDNSVPQSNTTFVRYTNNVSTIPGYSFQSQVTPWKIVDGSSTTCGLGRIQTFSEIGIQIICTADGNSPLGAYQAPVTISGKQVSPVNGSANDPLYVSNLPEAQFLRRTDGTIVGIDTPDNATTPANTPFPANQTLTTSGLYGGTLQALAPGEKKLQAMLLFEIACPTMGFDSFQLNDSTNRPAYKINVSGIGGVEIAGQNPFPNLTNTTEALGSNLNGNGFVDRMSTRNSVQSTGGLMGFRYLIGDRGDRFNAWSGNNPYTSGTLPYRYVSKTFKVATANLSLGGGFKAEIHVPATGGSSVVAQTVNVSFPSVSNIPLPDLPRNAFSGNDGSGNPFLSNVPSDWWGFDYRIARANAARSNGNGSAPIHGPGAVIRADIPVSGTWSWTKAAQVRIPTFANQGSSTFSGSDVVRTLVARDGDYRLVAAHDEITADGSNSSPFAKGPGYDSGVKLGHLFKDQNTSFGVAGVDNDGKLVAGANYSWQIVPKVPSTLDPNKQAGWDWDTGLPAEPDGAYANKPDEGNIYTNNSSPYYNREQQGSMETIVSYFTPNRIVSSPVMFGSLPTGVRENISWRTLLFRPQKTRALDPSGLKDHLLLDLFWMPVVEPYAISEPFSTAGKVNMNYQIVPFTYINRSTSVRAVLGSELVARVPKAAAANLSSFDFNNYYKGMSGSGGSTPPGGVSVARLPLYLSETDGALRQFKEKFDQWKIFKSASEICDIYLTPNGYNWTTDALADAGWYGNDFAMVGDNVRERPYSNIYPRLTTKSNTFTVHYTVQSLKNPSLNPGQWNEDRGAVTGEFRGSTTLERYINPANSKIPDFATTPTAASLDTFYQWRIVSTRSFSP